MPLRSRKRGRYFDVPVQHMVLRIAGPEELYEEVRATGMQYWEQIQSYAIRHPGFQTSKRPLSVPEDAPPVVRQMAKLSAMAGVGPMFTFQGALTEYVGQGLAKIMPEVNVSCGGDHYVVTRKRARMPVHAGSTETSRGLVVIVKPELGPHGIYATPGGAYFAGESPDGLIVVARSCILADAAAAAAKAILARPGSFRKALAFLQNLRGVHGAIVIRGEAIGVAGGLELAA
jgi:uncharacterized protein